MFHYLLLPLQMFAHDLVFFPPNETKDYLKFDSRMKNPAIPSNNPQFNNP